MSAKFNENLKYGFHVTSQGKCKKINRQHPQSKQRGREKGWRKKVRQMGLRSFPQTKLHDYVTDLVC